MRAPLPGRAAVLVLAIMAQVGGCEQPPQAEAPPPASPGVESVGFPTVLEDDAGREIRLDAPPCRIVSLVPSGTEILMELGHRECLVARTEFDRAPELAHLPSVGGGLSPSLERLIVLQPDLVIRFLAESDPETPRGLDAAGIPHMAIRPDGIADVRRIIELLGRATGRTVAADSLDDALGRALDEVARQVQGASPPEVAFLLGGNPPLVAAGGSFLHELLELAGAVNVFEDAGSLYTPVSVEAVIRRAPEMILAREGADIPAVLEGFPIHRVPGWVESPGLTMGESARLLARIFHPDRIP